MLIAVFSNYFILLAIFGFSFLLKKILFLNKKIIVENIDFLYGLIFLIFFALLLNFFFPLNYFTIWVILTGVLIFLYGFYKKFFKINLFYYLIIIFFTTFVSFYTGNNVDSPMYHLQIIKWLSFHKISFGLSDLEIRFGFNSTWHSLVALLDLKIHKFSAKYYLSAIIFGLVIYEVIKLKEKINYSDLFLFLVVSFLIFFSFIHPYRNGIILNHLGNPERDIVTMFFFFLIIYIFLKIQENNNDNNNLINLLLISTFICLTSRIIFSPIIFILILILIKNKKYKLINLNNIFLFFTSFLWITRTFFLSGCFFFPVHQTCIKTPWLVNKEEVIFFVQEAMRISRTLPDRIKVNDYDFTINSNDWMLPWFKNYFMEAALLQAGTGIIIIALCLFVLKNFLKLNNIKKNINIFDYFLIFSLLVIIGLWFQAPEIRYGWGPLIVLPCFTLLVSLKDLKLLFFIKNKVILMNLSITLLCLAFLTKSFVYFQSKDLFIISKKEFGYTNIRKIGTFDNQEIYRSLNWQCADFKGICVNTVKKNYEIKKIFNYVIFNSN